MLIESFNVPKIGEYLEMVTNFVIKKVYLVYICFNVSFSQGVAGVPCPPFSVSATPLFCRLPDLPFVVGGDGRVYTGD